MGSSCCKEEDTHSVEISARKRPVNQPTNSQNTAAPVAVANTVKSGGLVFEHNDYYYQCEKDW